MNPVSGNLAEERLEPVETLYYYDGAILFTAIVDGAMRLVILSEMDDENRQFIYHASTPGEALLDAVRENRAPLRDAFLEGPFFEIREGSTGSLEVLQIDAIAGDFLPMEGVLLRFESPAM